MRTFRPPALTLNLDVNRYESHNDDDVFSFKGMDNDVGIDETQRGDLLSLPNSPMSVLGEDDRKLQVERDQVDFGAPAFTKRLSESGNPQFNAIYMEVLQQMGNVSESTKDYILSFLPRNPLSRHKREFDINVRSPPRFISFVYMDTNDRSNKIIKLYNYKGYPCNECDDLIVNEIAAQIYAEKFVRCKDKSGKRARKDRVKVPTIYNYGKFRNQNKSETYPYNAFFFVVMENISDFSQLRDLPKHNLSPEICQNIRQSVDNATQCLVDNDFFHNDLHRENVFIDLNNTEDVAFIDFGKTEIGENANPILSPVKKNFVCGNQTFQIGRSAPISARGGRKGRNLKNLSCNRRKGKGGTKRNNKKGKRNTKRKARRRSRSRPRSFPVIQIGRRQ